MTRPGHLLELTGPAATARLHRDPGTEFVAAEVWDRDCYRLAGAVDGATVVDIGANVGVTTLTAIAHGATRVVAVEPDAINLDLLLRNVEASDVGGRVDVHHGAAGRPGAAQVHRDPAHPRGCYGSSYTSTPEPGAAVVAQLPLEEYLAAAGTDLVVKIDVEGAEYDILAGAGVEVLAARVARLAVEWHHFPARGIDAFDLLPRLVGRLLPRFDVEVAGPPHLGGILHAVRR